MAKQEKNLFQKLSRLFKNGPVINRKIKRIDTTMALPDKTKSSGALLFQKSMSPTYSSITANAYNLSERLARYQDFCLTGDTLVALSTEAGAMRIDELVKKWSDGERDFWTFSYDQKTKSTVSARITGAVHNGVRHVISVVLDDGSIIRCTPEHKFMLQNSTYVEAKDLTPGLALMSITGQISVSHVIDEGIFEDVYDIEVRDYANFAIAKHDDKLGAQGIVIVHNCEMEYCLHKDTKIAVPGGYKTLGELSAECENNPDHTFIVYSYDHNKSKIVPAIGKQARQTRVDHAYAVTFDNGQKIIGNAIHRLMKRDGTFCKIEDLIPGDAMMPFYRRDLFNGCKEEGNGYRWIYTMDKESSFNGWTLEHRLLGQFIKGDELADNEVIHHKNFVKYDNSIDNLQVMTANEHKHLHAEILNGNKWSEKNKEWIEQFKINHSKYMSENNPAERKDITFGRILETSENTKFNLYRLCEALDTDPNVIKRRLRKHGYQNYETFARAYNPDWRNAAWDNQGTKNPRYVHSVTFDKICSTYSKGMSKKQLADSLSVGVTVISNRLKDHGYKNYTEFTSTYTNLKILSVEYYGEIPLYDLTVDGYKNFATDSVISHNTAEIAAALDIYSDETTSQDSKGRILHIHSDNEKIADILEDLFYNTVNVEFNLRPWARNLIKYGDLFLYTDVHPEDGVINVFPIPVNEIEREENFDKADPFAVRFRWVSLGNRILENWEVAHFRLLGNDMFIPYGSSLIEAARRIWRQLILIEDAMLVYRIVRAPERRAFYIDVGNLDPKEVPLYLEEQKKNLRTNQVVDRTSGRVDLRYNPFSIDEDYFLPVRGGDSGTKIDTLAGGQNTAAVEDVAYIQKKLFAALKIPRAYLGYDESLGSKATLAQEDIRFSRTVTAIQRVIISELNKLAIIHLYAKGFDGDELQNFTLKLSNPSTIAQQQKLELWRTRFEIAGSVPEGVLSREFIRREILELNEKESKEIDQARLKEKFVDQAIESSTAESDDGGDDDFSDLDMGGGGGGSGGGGGAADEPADDEEELPPEENASEDPEEEGTSLELITSSDDNDDDVNINLTFSASEIDAPVNVKKHLDNVLYNRGRRRTHGASKTHMPDFAKMTSTKDDTLNDPFDHEWMKSVITNPFNEDNRDHRNRKRPGRVSSDVMSILTKFREHYKDQESKSGLLREDVDEEVFIDNEDE